MANKSIKALKDLSKEELVKQLRQMEADQFKGRISLRTGQLENTASLWKRRKDIARVKMLLTAKEKTA